MQNRSQSLSMQRKEFRCLTALPLALALMGTACVDESRPDIFAVDPDAGTDAQFVFEAGSPCEGDCVREPGADPDAGRGKEGGGGQAGECLTDNDCGDGNTCTRDLCDNGICRHDLIADPREAGCPAGQVCNQAKGCIPGPACATDAQCEAQLASDPCKVNIRCHQPTATCEYSILDRDRDGHPPLSCGGGDCNDADATIHPQHPEECDGKDNNCNGLIDEDSVCDLRCGLSTCPEPPYQNFLKCCTSSDECGWKNGPSGFCYDVGSGGGGGGGGGMP